MCAKALYGTSTCVGGNKFLSISLSLPPPSFGILILHLYVCGSACVCVCACHFGVQYYYANYLFDISIEITMHLARLLCLRCVLLKQCLKLWKLNRNSMVCFWILFKISTFNMS